MQFTPLEIAGAYLISSTPVRDERGHFVRHFHADSFREQGLELTNAQVSLSHNPKAHTLRGLHYIPEEIGEAKLVRCSAGRIYDVLVDFRTTSATYKQFFGLELSPEKHQALYIPRGCAHGFITLADNSDVMYQFSMPYRPGIERGVRWDDPDIGIEWPSVPVHLSDQDRELPFLANEIRKQ
jgi:dTDP-4-dehydrorhamnose 3,5-epimerase